VLRPPPQGPPVEAAPEAVETLVGMGFDRARAAEVLRRTGNDVQAAIAQLVS
jgi:Holliday junction resolvasome RuvABC DNA-binding subunit